MEKNKLTGEIPVNEPSDTLMIRACVDSTKTYTSQVLILFFIIMSLLSVGFALDI